MYLLTALSLLLIGCVNTERYILDDYMYWTQNGIQYTKTFSIDYTTNKIILAAENSICHLDLDFQNTTNVKNVTPSNGLITFCQENPDIFKIEEECQNFHQIIQFPQGNFTLDNNNTLPLEDTVIICGTNAYHPRCIYRNRTNLDIIANYSGINIAPYDGKTRVQSIFSSTGSMVTITSLNIRVTDFALVISSSPPFNGGITLRTVRSLNLNIFNKPTFASIIEYEHFYYIFFKETAVEAQRDSGTSFKPVYSRVGRLCKNDTGTYDINANYYALTTFYKARIYCRSQAKSMVDFPFVYNDLQDTAYVPGGPATGGSYLYAAFTSEVNAPTGSAVCLYTFNKKDKDLTRAFEGNFLEQTGTEEWEESTNNNAFSCVNRTLNDATHKVLMYDDVIATEPLFVDDGMFYHQILVEQVRGLDGVKHDVFMILATSTEDVLYFLKKTHVPSRQGNSKEYTSQSLVLQRHNGDATGQEVGKMELYKSDDDASVYISTDNGLYLIALSNCSKMYSNCNDCVGARDPYCSWNIDTNECVHVSNVTGSADGLIQDVVNGDITGCPIVVPITTTPTTTSSDIISSSSSVSISYMTTTETITMTTTQITPASCTSPSILTTTIYLDPIRDTRVLLSPLPSSTSKFKPVETVVDPSTGGINENNEDHTWTIVAACGGTIVGIVIGFLLFAVIRNKDKFCWGKYLSRRRRYDFNDEESKTYELPNNYSKVTQFERSSTPPLSKLNPIPNITPQKVTDSPILTKYANTKKHHSRSLSSGGQLPMFPMAAPAPTYGTPPAIKLGSPVLTSPMVGSNLRKTFHVEQPITNSERQRYGKNMIERQLSKEYPMDATPGSNSFHMKTFSLDLDYDMYK